MQKKIAFLSVVFCSFTSPLYASHPNHPVVSKNNLLIQIDDIEDSLKLLPDVYRDLVKTNLSLAQQNKTQILAAISEINPSYREGLAFLLAYMPSADLQSLSKDFLIENVSLAYKALNESPWSQNISQEMFLNYILPYANVNERRDNWRSDFYERFYKIALEEGDVENIVKKFNTYVFDTLNVHYHAYLREKPHQSPYESMKIGYASCTGLSILLADALRSVGIPARLAGIVSWPQTGGNHTWVEVWDNGNWHYIGASEPSEYDQTWFTEKVRLANPNNEYESVFAVSYKKTDHHFPMVWDFNNQSVSAENVTLRYIQ